MKLFEVSLAFPENCIILKASSFQGVLLGSSKKNLCPFILCILWVFILSQFYNVFAQIPEFNSINLAQNLNSPMQISIASDGRVFIAEKGGTIKIYSPQTGNVTIAGTVTVRDNGEGGMLGLALDPDFGNANNHIYMYYSEGNGSNPNEAVVRYTLNSNGTLDLNSNVVVLRVPDSGENEHSSGGMLFDGSGNLFIGTGDDTWIGETNGFSPMDERPGRAAYDAQKSAANNNDLRGAILRITPNSDGAYDIPEGNLFPVGHPTGRLEIYIMGCRNPFRQAVDPKTQWLYWAEPGPNSRANSASRGPRGHDEINIAKVPGNYGWPYFVGPNVPYVEYDYATGISGNPFNPDEPINNSPNNTGDTVLPPAQPAIIWHSYESFPEWPMYGSGPASSGIIGPFYRFDPELNSDVKLSRKYESVLFEFDWSRSFIKAIRMDDEGLPDSIWSIAEDGQLVSPGPTNNPINNPIDMKLGPEGALYVLAWGNGGYPNNQGAGRLIRLDYIGPEVGVQTQESKNLAFTKGRLIYLQLASVISLPQSKSKLKLYDLNGKLVWKYFLANNNREISIPENFTGRVYFILFE